MRFYRLSLLGVVTEERLFDYYTRRILGRGQMITFAEWLTHLGAIEVDRNNKEVA